MNEERKTDQDGTSKQHLFDIWQAWYEKEWKPFFNVPQLGLTRYYQEHVHKSLDMYYEMQGKMTELANLLYQPVEKSLWEAQNDLFASALKGLDAKEAKPVYSKWITALEKQYMQLFRSPDFIECLNKTMGSFNDFIISRQTVLEDLLKMLPVPTNSDMDDLYKELYELKKRVRDLEKMQVQN